jgi:hypothetical protein
MGAAVPMLVIRMELLEKNQAPQQQQQKKDNPLDILWIGGQREVTVREQNSTSRQLDSCQSADMKRIVS